MTMGNVDRHREIQILGQGEEGVVSEPTMLQPAIALSTTKTVYMAAI